jgi:hypothetical protein
MSDQTLTLPLSRCPRITRHDRRIMSAIEQAKTTAWLASPKMVAHRSTLLDEATSVASSLSRPSRSPVRHMTA